MSILPPSIENEIAKTMRRFSSNFRLIDCDTKDYFKRGVTLYLESKTISNVPAEGMKYKSAIIKKSDKVIIASGNLEDIEFLLRMIEM